MKQEEGVNAGDAMTSRMKNKKNEGMVCDGVIAYVCVLPLCVRVCVCVRARVSSQDTTRAHTHTHL